MTSAAPGPGQDDHGWYIPPSPPYAPAPSPWPTSDPSPPAPPAAAPAVPQPRPATPDRPSTEIVPHAQPVHLSAQPAPGWYETSPWGAPVRGARLATPGARLGALVLDLVLAVVTFGIGWIVWSLVVWGRGTTPAKSLMHQRVISSATGQTATWGHMVVRQLLVGGLLAIVLGTVTLYLWPLVDALMVFSRGHRRLTDRIAGTAVVQD